MADSGLHKLDDLSGYKVASDSPDVRGWKLVDQQGEEIGEVEHLLADPKAERVRYLDVSPAEGLIQDEQKVYGQSASETHSYRDRKGAVHLIVPIGLARLDEEHHKVSVSGLSKANFASTPLLSKADPIGRDHEEEYRRFWQNTVGSAGRSSSGESSGATKLSASDRSMSPGKTDKGKMTPGAPDSLEAGATAPGSQAGSQQATTGDSTHSGEREFYDHEHFDEERFYKRRS